MAKTTQDPKKALVDFIVGGGTANPMRTREKFEALLLLLYSMGKGFSADAIDGEWNMVFAQKGKSTKFLMENQRTDEDDKNSLLKIVGRSKNIFDSAPMRFYEETSVFKWFLFGKFVKVGMTS